MPFFPMYVDITDKRCLVVGGGSIAFHKILVLLDFGANVTVVADMVCDQIEAMADGFRVEIIRRKYTEDDCLGMHLVVAATDDKEANHNIAQFCKENRIPVNAVDQIDDCSFIFPSYIKEDDLVASFSSGGNSPMLTQYLKEKEKAILTPQLAKCNAILGKYRQYVKEQMPDIKKQRAVYKMIFDELIENECDITEKRVQEIIDNELQGGD